MITKDEITMYSCIYVAKHCFEGNANV